MDWHVVISAFRAVLKGLQGKNVEAVLGFGLFCAFLYALHDSLNPGLSFAAMVTIWVLYLGRNLMRDRHELKMARVKLDDTRDKRRLALEQKQLLPITQPTTSGRKKPS